MTIQSDQKKIGANNSELLFSVQNRDWFKSFNKELGQEAGGSAALALSILEKKAVAKGGGRGGFRELLMSSLEAVAFRTNLKIGPRHILAQTLAESNRDIRVLKKFSQMILQLLEEILRETIYDFPFEVLKREARVALEKVVEHKQQWRRGLIKELALFESRGNSIKPGKQDTFAVARLRAGVNAFTGRHHDPEICRLLEVSSRAAGRFDDSWNVDKLRKIAQRFSKEYRSEPELLPMELFLMTCQVMPEKMWEAFSRVVQLRNAIRQGL